MYSVVQKTSVCNTRRKQNDDNIIITNKKF